MQPVCSENFSPFSDYIMLTWEKIPGSPHFSVLQATESWAGPGNEARQGREEGREEKQGSTYTCSQKWGVGALFMYSSVKKHPRMLEGSTH